MSAQRKTVAAANDADFHSNGTIPTTLSSASTSASTSDTIPPPTNVTSQFVAAPRKFDFGEFISKPFLPLIPLHWHPNQVTLINHLCNWLLTLLCWTHTFWPSVQARVITIIACSVTNYTCTILDCLDGMHARKTKQCSRLGEFLDHWLDAVHVPLVTAGTGYCLGFSNGQFALVLMFSSLVYATELIDYHYHRVFIGTSGVEGQLAGSGLFLVAAVFQTLPADSVYVTVPRFISWCTAMIVCITLISGFVARYDARMLGKFAIYASILAVFSALYYWYGAENVNGMDAFSYAMGLSMISLRMTGCYVLFSIIRRPYKGWSMSIVVWLVVLVGINVFMKPTPVATFISGALPLFPASLSSLAHFVTVQRALPYVFVLHIGLKNTQMLTRNYRQLKSMN